MQRGWFASSNQVFRQHLRGVGKPGVSAWLERLDGLLCVKIVQAGGLQWLSISLVHGKFFSQ